MSVVAHGCVALTRVAVEQIDNLPVKLSAERIFGWRSALFA